MFVGYAGSFIAFGSPIVGQSLAGLHVLWLILAALLTKSRGSATLAGILKGSVELILPNHLGPIVFLISFFEGFIVDLVFLSTKTFGKKSILFASGLSAVSNVFVLQVFQILPAALPVWIFLGMYIVSFISGLILSGYLILLIISRLNPSIKQNVL